MASRSEAQIEPPTDGYPRCPLCNWHDRKLRVVGSKVTPEERIILHQWARHGQPLPSAWYKPPPEE